MSFRTVGWDGDDVVDLLLERPECARCRYDRHCEGVWSRYVRSYGWDELRPVAPA